MYAVLRTSFNMQTRFPCSMQECECDLHASQNVEILFKIGF